MKKDKLIALLQSIDGNPDILIWNGLVGDYQDIDELVEGSLVKQTYNHYAETVRLQECLDRQDWQYQLLEDELKELKENYKSFEWEFNDYVTEEDIKKKNYREKTVFLLEPKFRGCEYFDRQGNVRY